MKRALVFFTAVIMIVGMLLPAFVTTSFADALYIKKIVSVVYDDSGSMKGEKWAYANYAVQTFASMLNSDDKLFISYLQPFEVSPHGYVPEEIGLGADEIDDGVLTIRRHSDTGGTPFGPVQLAFDKLTEEDDQNPNTQYWLVVITDGDFQGEFHDDRFDVDLTGMPKDEKKEFLNEKFDEYLDTTMPNGSTPRITFMTIDDDDGKNDIVSPDEDTERGLYNYKADSAENIVKAMSEMADRISGRTRLDTGDIKQLESNTVRVSSAVPLLNIVVFSQKTSARITSVIHDNEDEIPVSRNVRVASPGEDDLGDAYAELMGGENHDDLVAESFLLGDSESVIGSGDYEIVFDKDVSADDLVVLFEPALEARMSLALNGEAVSDFKELKNASAGDNISVDCRVYEIGTDNEIDSSLLPPATKYKLTISEDGAVVRESDGDNMLIDGYTLSDAETDIKAQITIEGFSPIVKSVRISPLPAPAYSMTAELAGSDKGIKEEDLGSNDDLKVRFTVLANGAPITDPARVEAMRPMITLSPEGNNGITSIEKDGTIVFTPKVGAAPDDNDGKYSVAVTCTLEDGTSASVSYDVLISEYGVFAADAERPVVKTEFFNNEIAARFYVTKDGERLTGPELEELVKDDSFSLDEDHSDLKVHYETDDDGNVFASPRSEERRSLSFINWWGNWWYYFFTLSGKDVTVTFSTGVGSASAAVPVTGESVKYLILAVGAPLLVELGILLFLAWWVFCIFAKPKFLPGTMLYIGQLNIGGRDRERYHMISRVNSYSLDNYNRLKYRWKPTLNPRTIYLDGLQIKACSGQGLICEDELWHKGKIQPYYDVNVVIQNPAQLMDFVGRNRQLKINVISPYKAEDVHSVNSIPGPNAGVYYVHTKMDRIRTVEGIQTIQNGIIFAYANTTR